MEPEFVSLKPGTLLSPVPAVMVSCMGEGKAPNIITLAWVGTVNSEPPMCSISVRKERHSHALIKESGEFNERIAHISEYIGNAACISAENCTMLIDEEDPHFSRDAQIMLGERYADAVLRICYKTRNK